MTEWIEPTSSNRGIVGIFAKNRDNKAGHEAQLQLDGALIDLIERLPVGDDPRAERDAEGFI